MVNARKAPSDTPGETAPLLVWKMGKIQLSVTVNRQARVIAVKPGTTLLEALRDGLGLTGTKKGCDRGECGACTVHVDDRRMLSCMTLAAMQEGKRITTIEGWSKRKTSTRSRRPSSSATASNAASVRPGRSCRVLRYCRRPVLAGLARRPPMSPDRSRMISYPRPKFASA
jgi:ferredoxin